MVGRVALVVVLAEVLCASPMIPAYYVPGRAKLDLLELQEAYARVLDPHNMTGQPGDDAVLLESLPRRYRRTLWLHIAEGGKASELLPGAIRLSNDARERVIKNLVIADVADTLTSWSPLLIPADAFIYRLLDSRLPPRAAPRESPCCQLRISRSVLACAGGLR